MKSISLRTTILSFFLMGMMVVSYAQSSQEVLNQKREKRKNLTIREYNTNANGKGRRMDHMTVYNDKGDKVEEVEYATYGMKEKTVFEYNSKGHCIKEIVYDERNKVSRIRKYEYYEDGTKRTQYNYLPNGRLFSTKVYEYSN